jgi:hypothetical protein
MESTVKMHIRTLLEKLKFRSRVEAAAWAVVNQIHCPRSNPETGRFGLECNGLGPMPRTTVDRFASATT